MSDNVDRRTASQKIEDLEKVVSSIYQTMLQHKNAIENLLRSQGDMVLVKDALRLLNKKTEAMIMVSTPESGVTAAAVNDLVVKMNVEDLKAQVAEYVTNGHLAASDEVAPNSYVVCEGLAQDGTVANPRIQFRLDSQESATTEALAGKKVGDTVSFGEGKFSARVLEIYTIQEPKAEEAQPEAAAEVAQPAAGSNELPAESPVGFELQHHGQTESELTNAATSA